jgi:hypothetical protein
MIYGTGFILLVAECSVSKGIETRSSDLAADIRSTRELLCLQLLFGCYRVCRVDGHSLFVCSHCLPMAIRALHVTYHRDKDRFQLRATRNTTTKY